MAKFNPKKHDLTRKEAVFLTKLSKFNAGDVAKSLEESKQELSTFRQSLTKWKTDIEAAAKAADGFLAQAEKDHAKLTKLMKKADSLTRSAEKFRGLMKLEELKIDLQPNDPNVKTLRSLQSKMDELGAEAQACDRAIRSSFNRAQSGFHTFVGRHAKYQSSINAPAARLVPSQVKVLMGG